MKPNSFVLSVAAVVAMSFAGATVATAKTTLEIVKERGHLRCQVGPASPGFYNLDAKGNWYGSDVSIWVPIRRGATNRPRRKSEPGPADAVSTS